MGGVVHEGRDTHLGNVRVAFGERRRQDIKSLLQLVDMGAFVRC